MVIETLCLRAHEPSDLLMHSRKKCVLTAKIYFTFFALLLPCCLTCTLLRQAGAHRQSALHQLLYAGRPLDGELLAASCCP